MVSQNLWHALIVALFTCSRTKSEFLFFQQLNYVYKFRNQNRHLQGFFFPLKYLNYFILLVAWEISSCDVQVVRYGRRVHKWAAKWYMISNFGPHLQLQSVIVRFKIMTYTTNSYGQFSFSFSFGKSCMNTTRHFLISCQLFHLQEF